MLRRFAHEGIKPFHRSRYIHQSLSLRSKLSCEYKCPQLNHIENLLNNEWYIDASNYVNALRYDEEFCDDHEEFKKNMLCKITGLKKDREKTIQDHTNLFPTLSITPLLISVDCFLFKMTYDKWYNVAELMQWEIYLLAPCGIFATSATIAALANLISACDTKPISQKIHNMEHILSDHEKMCKK